jgi:hypothetical protein
MVHSTFEQELPPEFARDASLGHRPDGAPVAGGHYSYPPAAGGLWTTRSDLVRFALALGGAWSGRNCSSGNYGSTGNGALLSQEIAKAMFSPQAGIYGLGVRLERDRGNNWFWHTGGAEGFRAQMRGSLEDGRVAVVMSNGEDGMQLNREVLEAIYGEIGRLTQERRVAEVVDVETAPYAGGYEYRFDSRVGRTLSWYELTAAYSSLVPQLSGSENACGCRRAKLVSSLPTVTLLSRWSSVMERLRD